MRSGSFLENVIPAAILRLGCMNVHGHSIVSDSFRPPWTSPPGSSVHRIFQARVLEWVAISCSRRVFLTQGLNPCLLHLLHWHLDPLPLHHLELGEGDGAHSSALAWRIPGTEEPGGLLSMGWRGVGHD